MKKTVKKLGLDKHTLRQLTPIDLTAANGGTYSANVCTQTGQTCGWSCAGSCAWSCACPVVTATACHVC